MSQAAFALMPEQPLSVQVAEVLGWVELHPNANENGDWGGTVPVELDWMGLGGRTIVYRYDEAWEATGPLIAKYRISVVPLKDNPGWSAWVQGKEPDGKGASPLEAVCRLIVALKAEGKL